jgi:lantibiotic modifying enzyme
MILSSGSNTIYRNAEALLWRQIENIAKQIQEERTFITEPGLLDGKAGNVLLLAYLSKLFPVREDSFGEKNYSDITAGILDELSDSLSGDELGHDMSTGVAGIAFAFQHLRNIGVLDKSDDLNLSEMDEFINLGIDYDFRNGNWDPLHGMVGLGIYFLERNKETGEKKFLEKIIDYLAQMRTDFDEYKIWITPGYGKYNEDNYNFGMAHGMPGILSFLALVHARGIKQQETGEMISSCLPFLLQYEYAEDEEYCFPNSVEVNPADVDQKLGSRLAWCYGDLCMANTLIHCGNALQKSHLKRKGIEVALKTTHRNFDSAGCLDALFCHGSVGLVHQYNNFYRLTGNEVFKYAAENWLNLTLEKYYKPGEGIGGYFSRCLNEETNLFEYMPRYGLLEGSTGIALVYLSYLYDIKPDWDIVFLTNV